MAKSAKIKNSDLFDGNIFAKSQAEAEKYLATIVDIKTGLKEGLKDASGSLAGNKLGNSKDLNDYANTLKKVTETKKALVDMSELELKIQAEQTAAYQLLTKEQRQRVENIKNETIANSANAGTLEKLTAKNALLRAERAKVNTTTKEGQLRLQEINKELDKNNASIAANSDRLKRQSMNVGNYSASVKDALESTGFFGEVLEKFNTIQVAFNAFLELGTIGRKKDTVAEAAQTIGSEAHTVALEEEVVATEELTVAQKALNLATNPVIAILVALAGAFAGVVANTQKLKDEAYAQWEALKLLGKETFSWGNSVKYTRAELLELFIAERKLQDGRTEHLVILQKLKTEAAIARTAAGEDNKTTQQKINLLHEFIDKLTEASTIEREEAVEKVRIKKRLAEVAGNIDRKYNEEYEASKAELSKIDEDLANEKRRAVKQETAFIEQDLKDRLTLSRDSLKRENEMIVIEEDKQLANENARYEQEKADTLKKQKDLGNEQQGQQEAFDKENLTILQTHLENERKIKINATIKGSEQSEKTNRQNKEIEIANLGFMEIAKRRKFERKIKDDSISAIKLRRDEEMDLYKEDPHKQEAIKIDSQAKIKKIEDDYAKVQRERAISTAQDIANITGKVQDLQNQKVEDALSRDLHIRETNIEQQTRLAERGLKNQLAFEKEKLAQTQLAQARQKEKEIREAKVMAYFNAFMEFAKQDPDSAPFKALASIAIAEAISGAFKDGVEGFKGKGTDTSDSNLVLLSNNESVITASGTRKHSGLATAMNEDKVSEWFAENGSRLGVGFGEIQRHGIGSESMAHLNELKSIQYELKQVREAIQNKKESVTYWDGHGNMVNNVVENGMRTVITHIKAKPRI
jgi:hypothetical protein